MQLEKRSAADQGPDSAARVAFNSSCNSVATLSPASAPVPNSGSSSLAGARTARTEAESYDSGEEFNYEGKYEGSFYAGATKSSTNSSLYLPAFPSCSHSSSELSSDVPPPQALASSTPSSSCVACDPKGVTTICLPANVIALLQDPQSNSIMQFADARRPRTSVLVADSGATDHMIPDKSAFIRIVHIQAARSAWITTHLRPSWVPALPSSLSTGREFLFATASTCPR